MRCPRCRQDTRPGATLCPKCGASLRRSARRSGPASVDPNLNAIAKTAARLCDAHDAQIFLADGATLGLVAQHMVKATDVLKTSSPEAIADLVYEPFLSGFPKASVARGISVYKQTWNFTNLISKDGYDRLFGVMAGRQAPEADLKKTTPYETMVDMSFVRKARSLG